MKAGAALTIYHAARWWSSAADGRVECRLCPRFCRLEDGQRGFCGVRRRRGDRLELPAYGQPRGLASEPIEKKPLFHFLPGSRTFSFGTRGCNLACGFCQNWHLSRGGAEDVLAEEIAPDALVETALDEGCRSVSFTYNDPVVFAEYALDVALGARERGLKTVAVSAGYIAPTPRTEFFAGMDAANIDLKAFSEDFYRRHCNGRLAPVLDTLAYLRKETEVWLEVTTLLIPGENDGDAELERAADWFASTLGLDVPWHFTAFRPAYRFLDRTPTPPETLFRAREIARSRGIHHVYVGNLASADGEATRCAFCGASLIERSGFVVLRNRLQEGCCPSCRKRLVGVFG